ncbi:hypothetical protein [Halomarina litorea]|uniref:hypothetical protein n=1 Tax=Halomarina litorea TaxID=2961595 RepID=UPI0020C3F8CB|nr:hypothetical protein [Halomarina sp. BCD28]
MSQTDELLEEYSEYSTSRTTDGESSDGGRGGGRSRLGRLRGRSVRLFSPRHFLLALALTVGGLLLGGLVPLIPGIGILGVALAGFVMGLLSERRRYLEVGAAGAVAAGLGLVLSSLNLVLLAGLRGQAPELAAVGAGAGVVVALVGHYFGRDLRDGLTRDI